MFSTFASSLVVFLNLTLLYLDLQVEALLYDLQKSLLQLICFQFKSQILEGTRLDKHLGVLWDSHYMQLRVPRAKMDRQDSHMRVP